MPRLSCYLRWNVQWCKRMSHICGMCSDACVGDICDTRTTYVTWHMWHTNDICGMCSDAYVCDIRTTIYIPQHIYHNIYTTTYTMTYERLIWLTSIYAIWRHIDATPLMHNMDSHSYSLHVGMCSDVVHEWCGIYVVVYMLWYICCGIYIVVYILWYICGGIYVVVYILWYICCGIYIVVGMLWYIYCGTYVVVCMLWYTCCSIYVVVYMYMLCMNGVASMLWMSGVNEWCQIDESCHMRLTVQSCCESAVNMIGLFCRISSLL